MNNSDQSHEQHADGIVEAGKKAPLYFYLLFYGLIIWGVIFSAYYLLSGWSSSGEFEEKMAAHTATFNPAAVVATASTTTTATIDVSALYAANCAGCHGADGTGGFGSDLSSATYVFGKDPAQVRESIAAGRGSSMPPYEGQLSPAEIDALVDMSLKF